jgi:hypothetical protein
MNLEDEQALESRVDRALKKLPDLSAPRTLLPRIRAALGRRELLPWYRQPWLAWPAPLRAVSLALLGGLFVALGWGVAQVAPSEGAAVVMREVNHWRSVAGAIWGAVEAVYATAVLLLRHLGPWFFAGCLLVLLMANALCMGLGTICVRLAFARSGGSDFDKSL